jgi:hypothetical protein
VNQRLMFTALFGVLFRSSISFSQEPPSNPPPEPAKPPDQPAPASSATSPTSTAPPTTATTSREARIRELENKVERMQQALAELKAAQQTPAAAKAAVPVAPLPEPNTDLDALRGIVVTGYLQVQLENHEDSEDQLRPGGAPINQNRFLVRRGRFKVSRDWDYSSLMMELDGNTVKGPAFSLYHAEASLLWRGGQPVPAPPLVKLTMGIFDAPFGYEVLESPRTRFFLERSLQSRAFFPNEPDLGARLSGQLGFFRYSFAFVNGEPTGEPSPFAGQDPNNHKDFIGRVAAVVPIKNLEVSGGVSILNGKGFVKGADATKNTLVWTDVNEDRKVQVDTEIFPVPASAASPSYNFGRWATSADLQLRLKTGAGSTTLLGEIQLGSNMDRGLFIANPTIGGQDTRELGYYVGAVQEITQYAAIGFRTDFYDPNADFLGFQSGKLVPVSQRVRTYSPLVALVLPGRARLVFQYDFIRDFYGRDARGVPNDLANDTFTLRMQGEL